LDHWQQLNADAAPLPTQAIGYGQGKFLGLNNQHELLASTNARQWTLTKTFLSTEFPNALAFADGLWVLGGMILGENVPFLLTSADGATWNSASILGKPSGFFNLGRIRHTSEGWTALSSPGLSGSSDWLLQSQDGRTWTWSQANDSDEALAVSLSNGSWVETPPLTCTDHRIWPWETVSQGFRIGISAGGCSGGPQARFATSTDGMTWVERDIGTEVSNLSNFTLSNGRLIVLGSSIVQSDSLLSIEQNRPGDLVIRRALGIPVVVESSEDLRQWHTLTNLSLGQAIDSFTDPEPGISAARFYRARTP